MLLYLLLYLLLVPSLTMIILLQSHHSGALNIIAVPGPEACFNVQPGKTLKNTEIITLVHSPVFFL